MSSATKILLFLFAILPLACSGPARYQADMDRAESLFDSIPDQAVAILDSLPASRLNSDDRTRLAILRAEARYKAGFDDTASSALDSAVAYLRLRYGHPLRARAYHIAGIHAFNRADYPAAIVSLLHAEKSAATPPTDSLRLALIYRTFGDCFNKTRDCLTSLNYFSRAYFIFSAIKSQRYTLDAITNLAWAHYNYLNYDSAYILADSLEQLAKTKDNWFLNEALHIKFRSLLRMKRYQEAIDCYKGILNLGEKYKTDKDYIYLGLAYYNIGDFNKASAYNDTILNLFRNSPNVIDRELLDFWLSHDKGDYQKSFDINNRILAYQNEMIDRYYNSTLTLPLRDYYLLQEESAKEKIQSDRVIRNLLIILILLILLGLGSLLIYRSRIAGKNREMLLMRISEFQSQLSHLKLEVSSAQHQLTAHEEALTKARGEVKKLMASQASTLDSLFAACFESGSSHSRKDVISRKVSEAVTAYSSDPMLLQNIANTVDTHLDGIVTRFKADFPNLSDNEYRLFLLWLTGFSNQSLSLLFATTPENIYARKSRLKRKIKNSNSSFSNEYLEYLK